MIKADSAKSQIRATVARALANALVTGIDNCSEENRPLTQLQQIDLATMSVMAYDQAIEACGLIDTEVSLFEPDAFRYKHDLKRLARIITWDNPISSTAREVMDILRKYRD